MTNQVANPYHRFQKPYTIAHRGGGGLAPENSSCAFEIMTQFDGVHAIETDIHVTKDGVIVATHDDVMDRISNITGRVSDLTWAEIKEADAGYRWTYDDGASFPGRDQGCRILSLAELFERYGQTYVVNIDLKPNDPALIPPLLDLINEHNMLANVVIGSFHDDITKRLREAAPTLATAASYSETRRFYLMSRVALERFWQPHPQCVAFQVPDAIGARRIVDRRFITGAHRKGVEVHVWTINYPQVMRRLLDWGADGIITDYPDRLLAVTNPPPLQ